MFEMSLYISLEMVLLTLFVVLVESKFLAYAQSRLGPVLFGRNGSFQMLLDLMKLVTKDIFLIPSPSSLLAPIFLSLLFASQLAFSQHFILGLNLFIFSSVDSLMLIHLMLMLISNIFFCLTGFLSKSSYAVIGTLSGIVHMISLEIFVTMMYSVLAFSAQSVNFNDFVLMQNNFFFIILYLQISFCFIVLFMLESKSTPFDHSETESEVVAGYSTEYSGPMLMMFYLSEYMHLLMASVHFMLFFFGGWMSLSVMFFLTPNFLTPNSSIYFFMI